MRNLFIIHGTEGHPGENWFPWLKKELESTKKFQVYIPQFPTPGVEQTPANWFKVLENYKDRINEDTVFIGHSLGGAFLLRVLERFKIYSAYLISAPAGVKPILNWEGDQPFIENSFQWEKIRKNAKNIEVFHSDDDPYICLGNGKLIAEKLGVNLNFKSGQGHFNATAGYTSFPELRDLIIKQNP